MKKVLAAGLVLIAALAGLGWWALLDARAPAHADDVFDIAGYRALVASDGAAALPQQVNVEFVGEGVAPSFAAEAGDFSGARATAYTSFQIAAPEGDTIIDGAVDRATAETLARGAWSFSDEAYGRVLAAMTRARRVLITHEHLDHVMAIARHPEPGAVAPRLLLTRIQLDALPQHAIGGRLDPAMAAAPPLALEAPLRLAPGIVAAPMPGHSPGGIILYVRTPQREYLLIGDIVWMMSNIERLKARPRAISWLAPGVDPDRPAVLRQVRALHDLAATEPNVIILPAHDADYLRALTMQGVLGASFAPPSAP